MHHFVGADSSCISWGHAQSGELGYGPNGQKYTVFSFFFVFNIINLHETHIHMDVHKCT